MLKWEFRDEWNNKPPIFNRRIKHFYDDICAILLISFLFFLGFFLNIFEAKKSLTAMAEKICSFISSFRPRSVPINPMRHFFQSSVENLVIFNLLIRKNYAVQISNAKKRGQFDFLDILLQPQQQRMFFHCVLFSVFFSLVRLSFFLCEKTRPYHEMQMKQIF